MKYQIIPVTAFQQNCSLIWCEATKVAAFVDPGGDAQKLIAAAENQAVKPTLILLTHGHLDHVGAAKQLADHFAIPIYGSQLADAFLLENLPSQCQMFGFPPVSAFKPDRWLNEGDEITLGQEKLEVLHCPGHTPGHVVFFCRSAQTAWVGDVLFRKSIGRTDFPQGNHAQLIASIRQKLFLLDDDVTFIPGHGPISTIGYERQNNPFTLAEG